MRLSNLTQHLRRDIKPANLVVGTDGKTITLLDAGLTCTHQDMRSGDSLYMYAPFTRGVVLSVHTGMTCLENGHHTIPQ